MSDDYVADDRVLPYTRALSLCIVPFLVAGFVILYLFPQHTARLWAWPLHPAMTSAVLASAYLGGAYFFVRAALERRWHVLSPGLLAVTLFAGLLGLATVLQWSKFTRQPGVLDLVGPLLRHAVPGVGRLVGESQVRRCAAR